jgi:2'-5' RNA ligase
MTTESALVVLIPEADCMLETYLQRCDPCGEVLIPAHVTILYPFKNPDELTSRLIKTLRKLFLDQPAFDVSFLEVQRFPDMLYLAPQPAEPFRILSETVFKHFPDCPPYGGAFAEIIPHLTIAQAGEASQLDRVEANFCEAVRGMLPIHARVDCVTLMENSSGGWKIREQFPLRDAKITK